jgi:hypothetical protein
MNIFFVDTDPLVAASNLCDRHVNKMITETAQILCTNYFLETGNHSLYKPIMPNHGSVRWARQNSENRKWLLFHLRGLLKEFDLRKPNNSSHLKAREIANQLFDLYVESELNLEKVTPIALCFSSPHEKLNSILKEEVLPRWYFIKDTRGTFYAENLENSVFAYREYYSYKLFKDFKLPEWNWLPESKPLWYRPQELLSRKAHS